MILEHFCDALNWLDRQQLAQADLEASIRQGQRAQNSRELSENTKEAWVAHIYACEFWQSGETLDSLADKLF